MKNIYLVRHGEALDDVNNTFGGAADDPLTEKGERLAKELAEEIKKLNPQKIYSSPLQRARKTAEIIASILNLPLEVVEDLRERNRYGILTGMKMEEAKKKYPELVEEVKEYKATIEGAEDYDHFKKRVLAAMDKIIQENKEDILIVVHGGIFRIVMWILLNKPDFVEADLHAVIHIQEQAGQLTLRNSKGLKFK